MFNLILLALLLSTSCSSIGPGYGALVTVSKTPGNYVVNIPQNNEVKILKEGTGSVYNILWLFSIGDASIESAMTSGNIQKIHHIDNQYVSILGLIYIYTTRVYGE